MRLKGIVAAATVGLLSVGVNAGAANAAYPTSSFYVSYGNSFARGTVTWYNRSIGVSYTIKVVTDCRTLFADAFDPIQSNGNFGTSACAGEGSKNDYFTVDGASPGGYSVADVYLVDNATGAILALDSCERDRTYCTTEF